MDIVLKLKEEGVRVDMVSREEILLMIAFLKGALTEDCYLRLKRDYNFDLHPSLNEDYVYIETDKFIKALRFISLILPPEKMEFLKKRLPCRFERSIRSYIMPNLRSEIRVNIVQRDLQVEFAHAFKKVLVDTLDLGKDTFTFGIKHPSRLHWMGHADYLNSDDWDNCLFKLTKKICFYYGYEAEFLSELYETSSKEIKLIKGN